jgi:hypothetical protein
MAGAGHTSRHFKKESEGIPNNLRCPLLEKTLAKQLLTRELNEMYLGCSEGVLALDGA